MLACLLCNIGWVSLGGLLWVGLCCWDSNTVTIYQTMFSCIFQPNSTLKMEKHSNPNPAKTCQSPGILFLSHSVANNYDKSYPILDQNFLNYIPYSRLNCSKTIPFTSVQTLYTLYMGVLLPEWFQDLMADQGVHSHTHTHTHTHTPYLMGDNF